VDRATINADREDLAFLTADIVDANGVFVPTAANTVNFLVSGPGRLVGVDNGNAISLESYKGTSRQAFSGKCLAIVQSTGAAGQIVVTASSSGLTSGSATITAQGPGVPTDTPTATPTVTPTPGAGTNLALGKVASADSAQAANPASSGNDGSTSSRWCANDGNANHWWQVDLGATFSLSRSEVMWEFSGRVYRYRVEVSSNGSTWTTVADKTTNASTAQTQSDPFSATARYVRITVTGLTTSPVTWASFYEFRVFGS
jgi:Glycoside hydrolase family 2 C-terminal domain 5/F5/8 type C domain